LPIPEFKRTSSSEVLSPSQWSAKPWCFSQFPQRHHVRGLRADQLHEQEELDESDGSVADPERDEALGHEPEAGADEKRRGRDQSPDDQEPGVGPIAERVVCCGDVKATQDDEEDGVVVDPDGRWDGPEVQGAQELRRVHEQHEGGEGEVREHAEPDDPFDSSSTPLQR
jgi:hypothetical protein